DAGVVDQARDHFAGPVAADAERVGCAHDVAADTRAADLHAIDVHDQSAAVIRGGQEGPRVQRENARTLGAAVGTADEDVACGGRARAGCRLQGVGDVLA